MTYPSVKETLYHCGGSRFAAVVVPHGAGAADFFKFFPEIEADPDLAKIWPIFEDYLAIERDGGAGEIAHALAYRLASSFDIRTLVAEVNFPRGIVDGGRLRNHCLRNCLPPKLAEDLTPAFLRVHEDSLAYMDRLYEQLEADTSALLIDMHTMASYCPVDEAGLKRTAPVSFPTLPAYIEQYLSASNHAYQRKIDLICADESGRLLADPILLDSIRQSLESAGYACLDNEPYHAAPIYLSYQHMQKVPSISLDIPKHLIAKGGEKDLELDNLQIDPDALKTLADCLAGAIARAFDRREKK
jgi:hypothetical protein